mmetsp:Transcript_6371/g.14028  ORF Transcript_6371/g.14028 Transcript_6371/m.14028 type:complete len:115 (-) Transcript_6371:140-484(-)
METTVISLRGDIEELRRENKSLREQLENVNARIADLKTEAQAGLGQATVTSLRGDIDELRRENESLSEQLEQMDSRNAAGLEQATSAVSETHATVTSLRGDIGRGIAEGEQVRS